MIELTDENFEKEIKNSQKPIVVDFWASWCFPCTTIAPVLKKLEEDYQGKFILAKANLEFNSQTAQKYKIEQIPTVIFFKEGKPTNGFIGARPENIVKEWLDSNLAAKTFSEEEKIEMTIAEYEDYAAKNGYRLNPNREVVKRLAKGLLENEKKHGKKYCPCRRVVGNEEEDLKKICPCQFHKEEIDKTGQCLCGLFIK